MPGSSTLSLSTSQYRPCRLPYPHRVSDASYSLDHSLINHVHRWQLLHQRHPQLHLPPAARPGPAPHHLQLQPTCRIIQASSVPQQWQCDRAPGVHTGVNMVVGNAPQGDGQRLRRQQQQQQVQVQLHGCERSDGCEVGHVDWHQQRQGQTHLYRVCTGARHEGRNMRACHNSHLPAAGRRCGRQLQEVMCSH